MKPFFLVSLSTIVNKIEVAVKNRGRALKTLFRATTTSTILLQMKFWILCILIKTVSSVIKYVEYLKVLIVIRYFKNEDYYQLLEDTLHDWFIIIACLYVHICKGCNEKRLSI